MAELPLNKPAWVLVKTTCVDFPGLLAGSFFLKGCNLRCPYCYNRELVLCSQGSDSPSQSPNLATIEELFNQDEQFLKDILVDDVEELPVYLQEEDNKSETKKMNVNDVQKNTAEIKVLCLACSIPDFQLTKKEKEQVKDAIAHHTGWEKAPDYISACLWDADRCRLAWEWTFHERFFNTEIWKQIASHNAKDFLKFQNECLWRDENTDKENVIQISCRRDSPDWIYDMMADD